MKKLILCVLRFDSHPKKSLGVIRLCVLFVLLFTRDMRLTQLILTTLVGFRGTPLILLGVYLQMTFCWHNAESFEDNFLSSYYKSY